MNDIVGPGNALNATTTRPNDGRVFGSLDTWMKNCTTPTSQDGTQILAEMLNEWIAHTRTLIRANGLTLGGVNPVVTYDGGDDMILRAVQQLIQRGQQGAATDAGTANNLVVTLPVTPVEYIAHFTLRVKVKVSNTGASQIIVNSLSAVTITRTDGTPLQANDMLAGMEAILVFDGVYFQLINPSPAAWGSGGGGVSDFAADTSVTPNLITAAKSTPPLSYAAGLIVRTKLANNITGASQINLNGLGLVSVILPGGGATQNLDYLAGDVIYLFHNGTAFVCVTPINKAIIDTAVMQTVGSTGTFTTLTSAMQWVNRRQIALTGSLTLNLQSGQMVSSSDVVISHPESRRISIVGAALTGSFPTSISSTGNSSGNRASDLSTNFTTLRGIFNTELRFTGGAALYIHTPLASFTDILVSGDGSTITNGACLMNIEGGSGDTGLVSNPGGYSAIAVLGSGSNGIGVDGGSFAYLANIISTGHSLIGVSIQDGGIITVDPGTFITSGNGTDGIQANSSSSIRFGAVNLTSNYNGSNGVSALITSTANLPISGTVNINNNGLGVTAQDGSTIGITVGNVNNNSTSYGIYAFDQSRIIVNSAVACTGNATTNVLADGGSYIDNTGGALSCSPTANTNGNHNSWVRQ